MTAVTSAFQPNQSTESAVHKSRTVFQRDIQQPNVKSALICNFCQPQSYVINKQQILKTTENIAFTVILLTILSMIVNCVQVLSDDFIPFWSFTGEVLNSFVLVSLLCFYTIRLTISFSNSAFSVSQATLYILMTLLTMYLILSIIIIEFGAFENIQHEGNVYYYSQVAYDAQLAIFIIISSTFWMISIFVVSLFGYKLLKLVVNVRNETN